MQQPNEGLQPPLDKHLHLVSAHKYPLVAQLTPDTALRFLLDAPTVVKQLAPMSWEYVNGPPDGTIQLEWYSSRQNNGRFPSDGYVWSDPEQAYPQEINGYTIEILVHACGFRLNQDHMTSHSRTRYHLVAKAPHINSPAPDPSLWIVHYHHAPQNRIMPAQQLPTSEYTRHIIAERQWIESLGRIEQHQFMLHDREHWPRVPMPSGQRMHPGMYGQGQMPNQAMMNRNRFPPFPQNEPDAKRQRIGPGPMMGPGEALLRDTSIEEDEYAIMDHFDSLTPRDISVQRYEQHQRWMEEIFSSAYATRKIVPVDLGLGLMGELKGLTTGIVDDASLDVLLDREEIDELPEEAHFTQLSSKQVDEFGSRVQKFLDDGKAEIERMKSEHAAKLKKWKKTHQLTHAEAKLRTASWKDHNSTVFNVSTEATNGHPQASIEEIVAGVEQYVGRKAKSHRDTVLVEKGGLEEQRQVPQEVSMTNGGQVDLGAGPQDALQQSNPGAMDGSADVKPIIDDGQQASYDQDQQDADGAVDDMDMSLLQDGDMDMDTGDLNFELDDLAGQDGDDGAAEDDQQAQAGDATIATKDAATTEQSAGQPGDTATPGLDGDGGDMFDGSGFDFDGTGNEDGLIDFESGAMDDSAFGDALHGMEKGADDDEFAAQS